MSVTASVGPDVSMDRASGFWRREGGYLLELLALTGLAIAQPVLDVFGRSPETFILDGADWRAVVGFCAAVCLVPPTVLLVGGALTNAFGLAVRRWVQTVILAALFGLFVLQVMKHVLSIDGVALLVASGALAVGFAWLYRNTRSAKLWVRYLSPVPFVVAALFLTASPVAALLEPAPTGTDAVNVGSPHTVVWLTLDEFPLNSIMRSDGTIDAELFPGFARLAAGSTWYRNATAAALRTFYAVPALLTGRYPDGARLPVAREYPHNLFSLLGGTYAVHADETITRLCTEDVCGPAADNGGGATSDLLDEASSTYGTMIAPRESGSVASDSVQEATTSIMAGDGTSSSRIARFERFLKALQPRRGSRPSLHFLHVLLPHGPSQYYPSGARYSNAGAPAGRGGDHRDTWTNDAALVALARQRHLLQVQFADHLVSRMINRLQRTGLWDDAVVVVSPDHGIAFEPGQSSRNGDADRVTAATPEIVWIPMFVKAQRQTTGTVSDADVRTVDLLPTVADLLDVELPWPVDGVSAVSEAASSGNARSGNARSGDRKRFNGSWSDNGVEQPGRPHQIDAAAGRAYVRAHGVDHFRASGDPRWALYRTGPHPDLVGRRVADLRVGSAGAGAVGFGAAARFAQVAGSSGVVPGIVYGTVSEPGAEPIAVAVNGVIGGVAPRLADGEGSDFSVLPPDWLWHDGANAVTVYAVDADGTLHPIGS